ncbi:MAG: SGNH/GDSL hydrolase family protein [Prosthecobacter sp.]|uniref:SGNH/GDSL hydrolase family protein n=1 Tax=Prosthecobacter sp. TaxID=1965333 RepID=UPI0038FD7E43
MKKRLLQAGITAATLIFSALAGEVMVRWLVYVPRGTPHVTLNPDTIYYNKLGITGRHISPGEFDYEFNTNHQGFRGKTPVSSQAVVPRILCLGDSFTFGVGAADSETWPVRLQDALGTTGVSTEVVNAGVMGWGLTEYWIWSRQHASKYHPKLIIVGCHASDWENAFNGLVSLEPDGSLKTHQVVRKDVSVLKSITAKIPFYDFISTHSALAALIKESVIQWTRTGTVGGMVGGPPEEAANSVELAAPINQALLGGLQQAAAAAGAGLLVVFIPSHGEMEWGENAHHNYRRFRELIQTWTTALAIPHVDATLLLRAHLEKHHLPVHALFHVRNGHCTPLGYEVIATGVANVITKHPDWLAHGTSSNPPRQ